MSLSKQIKRKSIRKKTPLIKKPLNMSFLCRFCGRPFSSKRQCEEHEFIHQNIRISCNKCEKDYSNRANLHRHQTTKHKKETIEYAYVCELCNKIFPQSSYAEYINHTQNLCIKPK